MQQPNEEYFYHRAIRSQVIAFMMLFNHMKVVDEINDGETGISLKETPIDITYSPKERIAIDQVYQYSQTYYNTNVPKFTVGINSITYDSSRALNFYRKRRIKQNTQQYSDRMPVPYNIGVSLHMLSKFEGHINQIVENIAPFFSPYIIMRMKENYKELPDIPRELKIDFSGDVQRDIPIQWSDIERRNIRAQMDFTIRGWLYRPLEEQAGPIYRIPIRLWRSAEDIECVNGESSETIKMDCYDGLLDSMVVTGPNYNF